MSSFELPPGCKAFGAGATPKRIKRWVQTWKEGINDLTFFLVLAGSQTAEVEGISAAGATPLARRYTAVADAELLLFGPLGSRKWPLPALKAGISPALISFVSARWIGTEPLVVVAGLSQEPPFPHLLVEHPSIGPAACLSNGNAMEEKRVQALFSRGLLIGRKARQPLLIAECVPGGTTTAQAVLTGLGLSVEELISGSARNPPKALKKKLVQKGLRAADLGENPEPQRLLAAIGDPFQPFALGLLLGAREARQPVMLGGGSQMLAILALALASVKPSLRSELFEEVSLGTTAWLLDEDEGLTKASSGLERLMNLIGEFFEINLLGIASGLRFSSSSHQVLRDYELGYVKEGVGAGALSLLAQIKGVSRKELVETCERSIVELKKTPS